MEKRILNYVGLWGCLIMSNTSEKIVFKILYMVLAIICLTIYLFSKNKK